MPITRRDFLAIVFATVPVAALDGPLATFWPPAERRREVAEPYRLILDDSGYLCDPDFDYGYELPTRREALLERAGPLSDAELRERALDHIGVCGYAGERKARPSHKALDAWLDETLDSLEIDSFY